MMILRNSWPKRPAPIPPPPTSAMPRGADFHENSFFGDRLETGSIEWPTTPWMVQSISLAQWILLAGCCRELEGCLSRNRLCIEFFCELENWSERISKSRLSNFDRFDWILLSLGDGMIDATIERKKEKIIRASGLREESVRELNKFIVDDGMEVYYHSSSRCS